MSQVVKIRKKKKFNCPNPLFEQWIREWKDEAAEKGLKTKYQYGKALKSLQKYPVPLASGKEAKILEFFGEKICKRLDDRLEQHQMQNGASGSSQGSTECIQNSQVQPKSPNTKKTQPVIKRSQQITRSNRIAPVPCVLLKDPYTNSTSCSMPSSSQEPEPFNKFSLYPGTFDIVLYVDNCETISGHGKSKKLFIADLKKASVDFEIKKLHVGDFLWVARPKGSTDPCRELVMDFVVERKRLDDLWHSIKDGRFREQKFRLRNCGAPQPVYLIENYNLPGVPESTLEQAIVNTQVVDGFMIKRTQNIKESISYLSLMTKYLQNNLQTEILTSGPRQNKASSALNKKTYVNFQDFNSGAVKNKPLSVKEMFAKHLLQFSGLSVERALAIVERFDTLTKLLQSFKMCSTENERIKLIADIQYGKFNKRIGPALGRQIQQYYCTEGILK